MKVAQLKNTDREATPEVLTAAPYERALAALIRMKNNGVHHLVVLQDGKVAGMISDRDILARALYIGMGDELSWLSVGEAMHRNVPAVTEETEVGDALQHMLKGPCSALPIMKGLTLRGIITESDILRLTAKLLEKNDHFNLGANYLANPLAQKLLALISDLGI